MLLALAAGDDIAKTRWIKRAYPYIDGYFQNEPQFERETRRERKRERERLGERERERERERLS